MKINYRLEMEHERWLRKREAVEKWKLKNYDKYLEQKRQCAHMPSYLALRRERYQRSVALRLNLSTTVNDNVTQIHPRPDSSLDWSGDSPQSAPERRRPCPA